MTIRVNSEQPSEVSFRQVGSLYNCQPEHADRLGEQHLAGEDVFPREDGELVGVHKLGLDGLRDHRPDHPVEAGKVEKVGGAMEVKVQARSVEEHNLD